jgi:triosephosphate isomerase (TIM)
MYLIGNWKMTGSRAFAASYLPQVIGGIEALHVADHHTVIHCPPFPWLCDAVSLASGTALRIGAQDCHHTDTGAYTGDISASMVREAGCDYVIVGHSERRMYHHEDDLLIARKVSSALRARLIPIICVGETAAQRDTGEYLTLLHEQLAVVLAHAGKLHTLIVAYEPIWAIGTGRTPTVAEIDEVCSSIRQHLEAHGIAGPSVLYGGSVKAENCDAIFSIPSVGGVLVGGASIDAEQWTGIMKAATRHTKE